uniref:Uncharacterized protein n=1 Tax=Arundo donax TaxID=35708 RepID=A0A0A9ELH1_ARUDO
MAKENFQISSVVRRE